MERLPCQFRDTEECSVFRVIGHCFEDVHHLFWPKKNYITPVEKEFRALDENKVIACRNIHNIEHAVAEPPTIPDLELMEMAITEERNKRFYDKERKENS